jgi:hypothetical protein
LTQVDGLQPLDGFLDDADIQSGEDNGSKCGMDHDHPGDGFRPVGPVSGSAIGGHGCASQ